MKKEITVEYLQLADANVDEFATFVGKKGGLVLHIEECEGVIVITALDGFGYEEVLIPGMYAVILGNSPLRYIEEEMFDGVIGQEAPNGAK